MGKILKIQGSEGLIYLRALGAKTRLEMVDLLNKKPLSITEIADAMKISQSSATKEIKMLEHAGLVRTQHKSGIRGSQKICELVYSEIIYSPKRSNEPSLFLKSEVSIPVGAYKKFEVHPTCGLLNEKEMIGMRDDTRTFFNPKHISAQMLWFSRGWVEYTFPRNFPKDAAVEEISISMEISSEGSQPIGENECPSDISIWLNGVKIGPWHSWGFYTLKRGKYTPLWWPRKHNQFGLLKEWTINKGGCFVDGEKISQTEVSEIDLNGKPFLTLRIGVDEKDRNIGGVCLFGEKFGNHPQDILVTVSYQRKVTKKDRMEKRTWERGRGKK